VDAYGGGIYAIDTSTVDATGCNINGNQANGSVMGEGGGVYYDSTSVLSLPNTNVKGNKATTMGNNIFQGP
jgi:hypothetical protein